MIKVSVIVPVHNSQDYLGTCLGNLVHQTLSEIELILVDDASTDQSLEILYECQKQFPDKVKVITLPQNAGPGGARNAGIMAAQGKYIGFTDSDDIVDPSMYEKLYQQAKVLDCDMVDCGFYNQKEDQAILYTSDELTGELDDRKRAELIVSGGYLWSRIFKSEIIKNDPHYHFREHAILEDSDFLTYAYGTMHRIGNVKEILYQYSYHPQNISESNTENPYKYHDNICNAINALMKLTPDLCQGIMVRKAVEYEVIQMYLYGMINCLKNLEDTEFQAENRMMHLKQIKDNYLRIPYDENEYILSKITGDNYALLQQL